MSWELAVSEWIWTEEMEGIAATFDHGSTFYWTSDLERYLDKVEIDWEEIA